MGYVNSEQSDRVWFVDPLDGTANFINQEDDFLVLVGLCEEHRPSLGIAYFPAREILCFAAKGKGAYTNLHGQLSVNQESAINTQKVNIRGSELTSGPYINKYHTGAAQYLISIGIFRLVLTKLKKLSHQNLGILYLLRLLLLKVVAKQVIRMEIQLFILDKNLKLSIM